MKITLLIILSLLYFNHFSNSQTTYAPIDAIWNYNYTGHSGLPYANWTVKVTHDTLINGNPTKELTRTYQITNSLPPFEPVGTVSEAMLGTIQVRNDSVFHYYSFPSDERFLYSFNMNINDTIVIDPTTAPNLIAVVDTVYSIIHEGVSLLKWELTKYCDDFEFGTAQIVQNIGPIDDYILWNQDGCPIGGGWWGFQCYASSSLNYNEPCNPISLGINDLESTSIAIYPIPSRELLTIETALLLSSVSIKILDRSGRIIQQEIVKDFHSIQMDISTLEAGTYMITILSDNAIYNERFIKVE